MLRKLVILCLFCAIATLQPVHSQDTAVDGGSDGGEDDKAAGGDGKGGKGRVKFTGKRARSIQQVVKTMAEVSEMQDSLRSVQKSLEHQLWAATKIKRKDINRLSKTQNFLVYAKRVVKTVAALERKLNKNNEEEVDLWANGNGGKKRKNKKNQGDGGQSDE